MLWYKAWLETRWRFLIGFVLLLFSAWGVVLMYPRVADLLPLVPSVEVGGEVGRQLREVAELSRTYDGYVWGQWFRQNLPQTWTLFAVLLGAGGLLAQSSGGGALYTLSLPVTRTRLLVVRAVTGLAELLVLAVVPSLLLSLLSPLVGERYPAGDALIHGVCVFAGGAVFFSLAFLLSTIFHDLWRPLLIALCAALLLALAAQFLRELAPLSVFRVMTGESYFRTGVVPWRGLAASATLSLVLLFTATRNIARQDF